MARTSTLTFALVLGLVFWLSYELLFPSPLPSARGGGGARGPGGSSLSAQLRTHGVNRVGDRVMVVARYKEDSSWVDTYFNDFPHVVITPGLPGAAHTTPKNKGNEVGPFLHYILENYDRLPAHMAFIHGHRVSHHTYQLDIVPVMKAVRWGAMPYLPLNVHMYQRVDSERPEFNEMRRVWPVLFSELAPTMPKVFLSWCCAQFVVTRAAVRARPRAFYQNLYDWVNEAHPLLGNVTSYISSRVLEQTWHMIFGMPAEAEMIPACDVFHCDVLDVVTEQVETWEGTPFDRIPCKVYDIKHISDWRTRISPTHAPGKMMAQAASAEELKTAERETKDREEAAERAIEEDTARRASGELRAAMKLENTEVDKYQTGFGRPEDPPFATLSEEECARRRQRGERDACAPPPKATN